MSATYLAVARSVQGLRGALAQWAETRLAGASLGGMEAAGVELRVVRLEAGREPETGADFSLMGRWGSPPPAVVPGLPGEWAALGRGLRERLERLARDLAPADAQDELPPPTPLLLSDLPKDLRAWYLGQGDVPAAGPGWPDEAWTFDEGAARRARLPMLTWSPGIDLSFRVAFVADTRPADASAAIAVLATAARLERELRLTDGAAECPEALADLVRSIDDGEGLQALLDAATSRSVAPLALKVQPGGPEVRQDELSLVLDLVLTAARGARLSPAARAEWRLAPRTGSSGRTRRG